MSISFFEFRKLQLFFRRRIPARKQFQTKMYHKIMIFQTPQMTFSQKIAVRIGPADGSGPGRNTRKPGCEKNGKSQIPPKKNVFRLQFSGTCVYYRLDLCSCAGPAGAGLPSPNQPEACITLQQQGCLAGPQNKEKVRKKAP